MNEEKKRFENNRLPIMIKRNKSPFDIPNQKAEPRFSLKLPNFVKWGKKEQSKKSDAQKPEIITIKRKLKIEIKPRESPSRRDGYNEMESFSFPDFNDTPPTIKRGK